MNLTIRKLSEEHLPLVDAFFCAETAEILKELKAKERRRIIKHSQEMEEFLKQEALSDQKKGLNTTHLFIDEDKNCLAAYISLCNDGIRLEFNEKKILDISYTTVPAIKIARLAVANDYKGRGIGRNLIEFAAYIGEKIRERSGLVFITLDCYKHRLSYYESIGFVRNQFQPIELPYDSPISMRLGLDNFLAKMNEVH